MTMVMTMGLFTMKTIIASEFKAKCLKLMDQVAATGEELVVTKNGVPVGRFVPYRPSRASLFGLHGQRVECADDLVEPLAEPWEAAG